LTAAAQETLTTNPDADARAETATQLIAKALTDLRISAYLLEAADNENESSVLSKGPSERTSADGSTEELLQIITGRHSVLLTERSTEVPKDPSAARTELLASVEDTLALISARSSKTGQAALAGLLGIGLGQVGQAAGLLGSNVAQALGQADTVSRWYRYVRDFALKSYDSVAAALGPTVVKIAGQQVVTWVGEIKDGKLFGVLLEQMYCTKKTNEELAPMVKGSNAPSQDLSAATQELEKLAKLCAQQTDLIDKILKGAKFLGAISIAILPYGALLMGVLYVSICGYVVLSGADYVDAESIKLLDRVPGVRQIVITNLKIFK
jgi:hypothetical protein